MDNTYEDALNEDELKQKFHRRLSCQNMRLLYIDGHYEDGHYEEALSKYEAALQVAAEIPSTVELCSICHANCAICFLKLGNYEETVKECTKSLELNPGYMKALIGRAEANEKLEHYEEAIADYKNILEVDPKMIMLKDQLFVWSHWPEKSWRR